MDAVSVVVFGLIGLACVAAMALLDDRGGRATSREHVWWLLDYYQYSSHVPQVPHGSPSDVSGPGTREAAYSDDRATHVAPHARFFRVEV